MSSVSSVSCASSVSSASSGSSGSSVSATSSVSSAVSVSSASSLVSSVASISVSFRLLQAIRQRVPASMYLWLLQIGNKTHPDRMKAAIIKTAIILFFIISSPLLTIMTYIQSGARNPSARQYLPRPSIPFGDSHRLHQTPRVLLQLCRDNLVPDWLSRNKLQHTSGTFFTALSTLIGKYPSAKKYKKAVACTNCHGVLLASSIMASSVPDQRTRHFPDASQNAIPNFIPGTAHQRFMEIFDCFDECDWPKMKFTASGFSIFIVLIPFMLLNITLYHRKKQASYIILQD